jgi:hypothetical protein
VAKLKHIGCVEQPNFSAMRLALIASSPRSRKISKVAFNMSFGIFGWYWKRETQVTNGVEEGVYSASGANFKINLFNLNMGVSIFI